MYVTSHLPNHQSALMKHMLLLSLIGISALTSCSTAYKAGQTPDDVYYSPARELAGNKEDEKKQEQYEEYISSADDRYLRMKVANGGRWNSLDDYSYWYDSRYDFCPSYSSPYTSYSSWGLGYTIGYGRPYYGSIYGGWNSPVYTLVYYSNPKFSGGYTSGSNISAYRNKSYSNQNIGYTDKKGKFIPATSGNNNAGFANLLKRVFTPATSNSSSSSYDRPARTFSNSNSSSTPSTSSSAGGSSGGFKSTGSSAGSGRAGRG
jgi:hypothetical protein